MDVYNHSTSINLCLTRKEKDLIVLLKFELLFSIY
jgi:hypothetical protein